MIREAPARRAAAITCIPTPPQPITHTVSPIFTPAAFRTAPTPVTTAHPRSAASTIGSSGGIGTALAAGTTHASAKQDTKLKCSSGSPVSARRSLVVPSSIVPFQANTPAVSQRFGLLARHAGHTRHAGAKLNATWSPGWT